jgi:hypothetical protein
MAEMRINSAVVCGFFYHCYEYVTLKLLQAVSNLFQ